jgi:ATP-dependent Clp protease ATP-binding subunit ClpA
MLKRFTDQARRVVVLAEEEARTLDHNWIGTEHLLLGLLREGEGVAARALESLGITLPPVRQQVEEITGRGQQVPSEVIPFTPRSKKVLELSLLEAMRLGHEFIGTEHILLGLIRESDGVAAQILVKLGAGPNRVREQVLRLLPGPDTSDQDEPIGRTRVERHVARDYEQVPVLREREMQLLAARAARREQWAAEHSALADLTERVQQLTVEVERLRALLRQHGIEPQDEPA